MAEEYLLHVIENFLWDNTNFFETFVGQSILPYLVWLPGIHMFLFSEIFSVAMHINVSVSQLGNWVVEELIF